MSTNRWDVASVSGAGCLRNFTAASRDVRNMGLFWWKTASEEFDCKIYW